MARPVVLLILALVPVTVAPLPPPAGSYNILMLLPLSTKSHRNLYLSIAEGLADRGHDVTMVTNHSPVSKHHRIHEIYHKILYVADGGADVFQMLGNKSSDLTVMAENAERFAWEFYQVPKVAQLYARRHLFDVIFTGTKFNEVTFPFIHGKTFVVLDPSGIDVISSALFGNVLNPAYVFVKPTRQPRTFLQRMLNLGRYLALPQLDSQMTHLSGVQDKIEKMFPALPPVRELRKNMTLAMYNSDHCYDDSVPLLPSQVEIACIQCRVGQPLKQHLLRWMQGAGPAGVIYFSLGTEAQSSAMPSLYLDLFVAAFARLPQRVIWKCEDELEGLPSNVLLSKWLPQQDILAHSSVKVFITHGGLMSIQESIYHAVPLLVLPITGDQFHHGNMIAVKDYGIILNWKNLSINKIVNSITELIENKRYKDALTQASECLHDQLETPLERAVWWTEYISRHQIAPFLRSPAADMSFIEIFFLDVILIFFLLLFPSMWLFCNIMSSFLSLLSVRKRSKSE
ncbi:UDP-glucosyltransferase 2-like isoform X2 [Oratosquilla oratoria]